MIKCKNCFWLNECVDADDAMKKCEDYYDLQDESIDDIIEKNRIKYHKEHLPAILKRIIEG